MQKARPAGYAVVIAAGKLLFLPVTFDTGTLTRCPVVVLHSGMASQAHRNMDLGATCSSVVKFPLTRITPTMEAGVSPSAQSGKRVQSPLLNMLGYGQGRNTPWIELTRMG